MKKTYRILGLVCILFALSCDLDKDLDNPNEVGPSAADPTLLMNGIQTNLGLFFEKAAGHDRVTTRGVDELVRMRVMSGGFSYITAYLPQSQDDTWEFAYQRVLVNIEALLPLAEAGNLTTHIAAAKIIKAYVFMTLVDMYGDVPATEAIKGAEGNLNPAVDTGASVYAMAITMLDEARVELAKPVATRGAGMTRDIYYSPSATAAQQTIQRAKWNALANSLELKAQLNMTAQPSMLGAATARIATLLAGDLVDTQAEEFTYKYGTAAVPATSQHPYYRDTYRPVLGSANGWIGMHFLKKAFNGLVKDGSIQDPRWRYYFYRQVGSLKEALAVDPKSITCLNANVQQTGIPQHYNEFYGNGDIFTTAAGQPLTLFCAFDPGFYGRDHGNAEGRNPDAQILVVPGVYPAGGRVDTNPTGAAGNPAFRGFTQLGQGANGSGILPIYMGFFTDFMRAEAIVRLGIGGDAKAVLTTAVNASINRVRAFGAEKGQTLAAGLEPAQVIYMASLGAKYDLATTDLERMQIVGDEYYKALWGNGLEAYNLYRRTSTPNDLQPIRANPGTEGPFWRSIIYPAVFANLNANSPGNEGKADRRVFWDGNPNELK